MQTVYQNPHDERPVGGGASKTMSSFNSYDDRPIGGNQSGMYDLSAIGIDEFEVEDNYSEVELATMDE